MPSLRATVRDVDWSWLTPESATFLGAALAAAGVVVGVLLRGLFEWGLSSKQLKLQRDTLQQQQDALLAQLAAQERIAAAQRADERARALLAERRVVYGQTLELATALARLLFEQWDFVRKLDAFGFEQACQDWADSHEEYLPEEAWSDAATAYERRANVMLEIDEANRDLYGVIRTLDLIAPKKVVVAAKRLIERAMPMRANDVTEADKARGRQELALNEFLAACREDLGAMLDQD